MRKPKKQVFGLSRVWLYTEFLHQLVYHYCGGRRAAVDEGYVAECLTRGVVIDYGSWKALYIRGEIGPYPLGGRAVDNYYGGVPGCGLTAADSGLTGCVIDGFSEY